MIVPRPLVAGDRVAVVSPAGPVVAERLDEGLDVLRSWDLEVVEGASARATHPTLPYLAGEDAARAKDLRDAWLDPSVAAVICSRGGYGVQRMLPYVDGAELVALPKLFVGFSDITALHEIFNAAGLVTLHAPMPHAVNQLRDPASRERLRQLLFDPAAVADYLRPPGAPVTPGSADDVTGTAPVTVVPGRAEGRLLGGNLALLAASLGTPTYARPDGGIVLLEDVGEDAYRADRLVTQLLRAGWFDEVAGVVLGGLTESEDDELVVTALVERLTPLGIPLVRDASIGHGTVNLAVPLGARVTLTATLDGPPTLTPAR